MKISEPKREEVKVTGEDCAVWFNDLYSSRNIIQVIKSRRMRLTGHVACMER